MLYPSSSHCLGFAPQFPSEHVGPGVDDEFGSILARFLQIEDLIGPVT